MSIADKPGRPASAPDGRHTRTDAAAHRTGHLELICGCMFAGKTTALIQQLAGSVAEGLCVAAFKHTADTRYAMHQLVAHSGLKFSATAFAMPQAIAGACEMVDVVGIDEAQFFDDSLVEVCDELRMTGKRVIVAGLDRTCFGDPFEPVPKLQNLADRVTKLAARCSLCGRPARFTQRLAADNSPNEARYTQAALVGGAEAYEPRCGQCFRPLSRR